MATKYAEAVVAKKYRRKNEKGEMIGGPMYALERGMGLKWLAILFCIFTVLASFGIGNTIQSNAISLLMNESFNISPYITGGILAFLINLVIIFGVKGISSVC